MKNEVIIGDCAEVLKSFPDECIDAVITDPPYGINFMQREWDKALPSEEALRECCRVLKPGAFGFFMCAPRQDVLSRMIIRLEDAGFNVGFSSIYWSFASGFPKAQNMSKAIDRKFGAEREIIGTRFNGVGSDSGTGRYQMNNGNSKLTKEVKITAPTTDKAREFSGAFAGAQFKPALECIIVVMRPLSEKTYIDQALKNGHGVTWLGNCRIPYENESELTEIRAKANQDKEKWINTRDPNGRIQFMTSKELPEFGNSEGRFPANLLCSDNCLDNGIIHKSGAINGFVNNTKKDERLMNLGLNPIHRVTQANVGQFSRYFSLDAWFNKKLQELPEHIQKTFPFLITPKPSKSEKNKYIENKHPTVKPLKLMSYLITMGSREGDVILDPFAGSGTTLEACKLLNRVFIGIDKDPENEKYMRARGQLDKTTLESFQASTQEAQ